MTEMYVAATDYLISFFCLMFIWKINQYRIPKDSLLNTWTLFFSSIALSSFLGGTAHGFFSNDNTLYYKIIWISTLLSIGITASSCWILGGYYLNKRQFVGIWSVIVSVIYFIYAIIVIFFVQAYAIAIYNYLPAILFLLISNMVVFKRHGEPFCLWIIGGILTSFLAAYVQQSGFSLSIYINYNSAYHLIQLFALFMIFKAIMLEVRMNLYIHKINQIKH